MPFPSCHGADSSGCAARRSLPKSDPGSCGHRLWNNKPCREPTHRRGMARGFDPGRETSIAFGFPSKNRGPPCTGTEPSRVQMVLNEPQKKGKVHVATDSAFRRRCIHPYNRKRWHSCVFWNTRSHRPTAAQDQASVGRVMTTSVRKTWSNPTRSFTFFQP